MAAFVGCWALAAKGISTHNIERRDFIVFARRLRAAMGHGRTFVVKITSYIVCGTFTAYAFGLAQGSRAGRAGNAPGREGYRTLMMSEWIAEVRPLKGQILPDGS